MTKMTLTIFHPNNNGTTLVIASFDDTIEAIISLLVNNRFIFGEQYYSVSISNNSENIKVIEYSKKLNELGLNTDANLYISHGSSTDYKAPLCTTPSTAVPPPSYVKSDKPKIKITAINGMNLEELPLVEIPNECKKCNNFYWLLTQLHSLREVNAKNRKLNAERDKLNGKVFKLSVQADRKKTAECLMAFAPIVVGFGTANITEALGIGVIIFGLALTTYGLMLSHQKIGDDKLTAKQKGRNKHGK